jgi:hypothetical protein
MQRPLAPQLAEQAQLSTQTPPLQLLPDGQVTPAHGSDTHRPPAHT